MTHVPPVRQWRVRFYAGRTLLASYVVRTINKRFARWEANDCLRQNMDLYMAFDRVTVSLVNLSTTR